MPDTRLNYASVLGIGFIHMLSIVQMLYLSSKSLFTHTLNHGKTCGDDRRKSVLIAWVIAYEDRDERRSLDIQALKNFLGAGRQSPRTDDVRRCSQFQHSNNCGVLVRRGE